MFCVETAPPRGNTNPPITTTRAGRRQRPEPACPPASAIPNPAALAVLTAGAAEPIVQCEQRNRRALIACLAPNRRVQIAGVAQPR